MGSFFGKKDVQPVVQAAAAPQVNAEPAAGRSAEDLRRTGRASLISTSSQGVLGNPKTGRRSLLSGE